MTAALFAAAWLTMGNPLEEWAFPAADTLEVVLTPGAPRYRVGQIIIIGNDHTPQSVILDQLGLYPGALLSQWRLRLAEVRLAGLGRFEIDILRGSWPRVVALAPGGSEFRDIYVTVSERDRHARSP